MRKHCTVLHLFASIGFFIYTNWWWKNGVKTSWLIIFLCVFSWRKSSLEKENHFILSDDGILQLKCSKRSKLPDVWLPFCHLKMRKKCGLPKWQRPTPRKIGMSPKTRVAKLGRIVGLQPFTGRVGRRRKRRWRSLASTPSIHPPSSTCPNLLSTPFFFKCVTLFIFFN